MTLRTQSASEPYVNAITNPFPRRNAHSGVRNVLPDLRPRWTTTAHPGAHGAMNLVTRFSPALLARAIHRGAGISQNSSLVEFLFSQAKPGPRIKSTAVEFRGL